MRITAATIAAVLLAGSAQAMTVADFLGRVDALKAKGVMALFARADIKVLEQEGKSATIAWHNQVAPAGRPRNACPPSGPTKMGQSEFMAMLEAVPPARRPHMSVTEATIAAMNRRYPCPA